MTHPDWRADHHGHSTTQTLLVQWGRPDPRAKPSIVYVYPDRDGKAACRVISYAIEDAQWGPDPEHFGRFKKGKSLAQELDERGYDLTTLKISIKRKAHTDTEGREG